jgi:hypothetical protein
MTISPQTFNLILGIGAALLALWTIVRFPVFGPSSVPGAIGHVALAHFAGLAIAGALIPFFGGLPVPGSIALAVIGGALPPLVYIFVSIGWLFRNIQGLLPARH